MTTYTSPHNMPIVDPNTDYVKDSAETSALAADLNAISQAANSAIGAEGARAEAAAKFIRPAVGASTDFNTLTTPGLHPIRFGGNPNAPVGTGPGNLLVGDPANGTIPFLTQLMMGTGGAGLFYRSAREGVWTGWKDYGKALEVATPQGRLVDFNTLTKEGVYPVQTGDNPNGPGFPGTLYVGEPKNSSIAFITHLHVATDGKGIFYRSGRDGVWSDWASGTSSDLGEDLSQIMISEFERSRGGTIGTNGLPVVCLRFDHHLDPFVAQILPVLKELKLPWAQAVNPGRLGVGDDNLTYAQLQDACINGGGEIYNHGMTHGDAQTLTQAKYEIIDSFDALNAGLPAMKVEGFMPPGVGDGGYMDWAPIREVERWKSPAAQMVLRRHAVTTAYMGNRYRPLGGKIIQGHSHRVMDGAQPYHWTQSLDIIKRTGTAVTFMLHPSVLTDGQNTIAEIRGGLELIAAARDAGEIIVLSPSATFIANIGSSFRRNLAAAPTIAAGGAQVIDVFNPDCRGALHELTWTGGGTITVTDSVTQKDATLLNNTVNVALTGGRGSFYIPYVDESTAATLTLASSAAVTNVKLTAN